MFDDYLSLIPTPSTSHCFISNKRFYKSKLINIIFTHESVDRLIYRNEERWPHLVYLIRIISLQ